MFSFPSVPLLSVLGEVAVNMDGWTWDGKWPADEVKSSGDFFFFIEESTKGGVLCSSWKRKRCDQIKQELSWSCPALALASIISDFISSSSMPYSIDHLPVLLLPRSLFPSHIPLHGANLRHRLHATLFYFVRCVALESILSQFMGLQISVQ